MWQCDSQGLQEAAEGESLGTSKTCFSNPDLLWTSLAIRASRLEPLHPHFLFCEYKNTDVSPCRTVKGFEITDVRWLALAVSELSGRAK